MNEPDQTIDPNRTALLLTGGGARAAYQVGCLAHIAKAMPEFRPQIITGISAGAINAAHLASQRTSWPVAVASLQTLWRTMDTEKVFRTGLGNLAWRFLSWGTRLASGGRFQRRDLRGMVDTTPLRHFLDQSLPHERGRLTGIAENLADGWLDALAIMTTNYNTGRSTAWVESLDDSLWDKAQLRAISTEMSIAHVLASSALPIFFPAIALGNSWHGDGGVRLTAPLSPALHLGARRILAVSPRMKPVRQPPTQLPPYPAPAHIAGVMLNAVFLDLLDYDALQMTRINRLLDTAGVDEANGMRKVEVMVLRPSRDVGEIAADNEYRLPKAFRFFERGLSSKQDRSADALSMVNFEPEYLQLLMELGEEDAAANSEAIRAFLTGDACSLPIW